MGRHLLALACLVSVAAVAAVSAPSTAVGRVVFDPPARTGWVRVQAPRPTHVIAQVRSGQVVTLRSRPFGRALGRLGALTRFGSHRALGVVATRRGRWLAVTEPGVAGNHVVWVDAKAGGIRYARTRLELGVELSTRTMILRRDGVAVRRVRVGIGALDSPTPTGHFAVTDKLNGGAYSASYGCCILALSATQPNLPAGWAGGDRIAIHGTLSASDFGRAVSAGCIHAPDATLRYLMRLVPLGTPVVIRS